MSTAEIYTPDLRAGWSWWHGESASDYYSRWFGTGYNMGGPLAGDYGLGGLEGEVYWDEGGKHHVRITPILAIRKHGDLRYGYDCARRRFGTRQAAYNAVPRLIEELYE
jgi:hypothetical protein